MASSVQHSVLGRAANADGTITRIQGKAGAASIKPGMLMKRSTDDKTLVVHDQASGAVLPVIVALESETPNSDTLWTYDIAYTNGDTMYAAIARPGDRFYMFLKTGENVAIWDLLESDGAGGLVKLAAVLETTIAASVVGRACAALNNASGGYLRLLVEIV